MERFQCKSINFDISTNLYEPRPSFLFFLYFFESLFTGFGVRHRRMEMASQILTKKAKSWVKIKGIVRILSASCRNYFRPDIQWQNVLTPWRFLLAPHIGYEKASKEFWKRYDLGIDLNSSSIKVVNFYFYSPIYPNVDVLSLQNMS